METEKTHGGKREGAGRKPANGDKRKDFYAKSIVFHSLEEKKRAESLAKQEKLSFSFARGNPSVKGGKPLRI